MTAGTPKKCPDFVGRFGPVGVAKWQIFPWKINILNTIVEVDGSDDFPFQGVIFRFHVSFPGCIKIMIGRKVLT